MPPIRTKKVTPEEQRIAKAIDDLKDGTHKNAAAAALAWRVPYNKLLRRYQGMPSADSLGGHNKTLNTHRDGSSQTVSKSWASRFIKRMKVLRHRSKPLSAARKAAQKRDDIALHFEKFWRCYQELQMKPENLHNFDETGFRIGCLGGQIVFTRTDKQVYISDPDNREIVTSMESISGVGTTTDPMMIMTGQVMKEKHFPKGLNNGIRIGVSQSGYTNDVLSLEWLKHFDAQTRPPNGESRMLVMDGHGSHLLTNQVRIASFLL